jgi:hypothetical protein
MSPCIIKLTDERTDFKYYDYAYSKRDTFRKQFRIRF